jgi:putative ATPase
VPIYLRDKSDTFRGALREHYKHTIGEHAGYKYPHSYPGGWVAQRYLPPAIEGGWFKPAGHGYEQEIIERLAAWRRSREE